MVGYQSRQVAVMADPMTSYRSMTSSGRTQMTDGVLLSMGSSPHRACAISVNPSRGHWGLWLDADCGGIISWGGVVGASVFVVVVDWLSPRATNRDLLG